MDMGKGGRDVTDGVMKVFETLGEKIMQLESTDRWKEGQKQELQKQLDIEKDKVRRFNEENSRLGKLLSEANEKIAKYESMVFLSGDGTEVRFVDMKECQTTEELVEEINRSVARGYARGAEIKK